MSDDDLVPNQKYISQAEADAAAFENAEWLLWELEREGIMVIRKGDRIRAVPIEWLDDEQIKAMKGLEMYLLTVLVIRESMERS